MMCCCGHDEAEHLGGPDLDSAALESLRVMRPAGDGGMCRARVGAGGGLVWARCECFNFCDCYTVTSDMDDDEVPPSELASVINDLLKDPRCDGYDGLTVSIRKVTS
jgi:hypothetical protein